MNRPVASAVLASTLLLAMVAPAAQPGEPSDAGLRATLVCEPASGPGRVRCDAEARLPDDAADAHLAWGDVAVLATPPFATPLRGRTAPADASVRDPHAWRWGFALAARERGTGPVRARVRVVVCRGDVCSAVAREVTADLLVR